MGRCIKSDHDVGRPTLATGRGPFGRKSITPSPHGEFEIYGLVSRPVRLESVPWTDRRCRVGLGFVDEQEAIFGLSQSPHMTKMKYRRRRRWQPEEGGFRRLSQGQLVANRSAVSFSKGGRRFQKKRRIKKLK